jgi:type I restriction enzyme M protein
MSNEKDTRREIIDLRLATAGRDVIAMPSGVFKPSAGVSTAILLFTKVYGPKEKVTKPATQHVWFFNMESDGYSLDDKRNKQPGFGDLQEIVALFKARKPKAESDRRQKHFFVPYKGKDGETGIVDEDYDLSFSRYKIDVFEEIQYEAPSVILDKLIKAEVGETTDKDLAKIKSGIVKELLELRDMIG